MKNPRIMRLALLLPLCALLGCQTPARPLPPEPASTEALSACDSACTGLRMAGCEEGGPDCLKACANSARLLPWPLGCWADAGTPADVRACGGARCLLPDGG